MTPDEFQQALSSVDAMTLAGREPAYWCGFKRGLQRAHFGRRFSTNTDHYAWLDFARDVDPFVAQLGRGYRAGLEAIVSGGPLVLNGHDHARDQNPGTVATADDAAATTDIGQKS